MTVQLLIEMREVRLLVNRGAGGNDDHKEVKSETKKEKVPKHTNKHKEKKKRKKETRGKRGSSSVLATRVCFLIAETVIIINNNKEKGDRPLL